MAMNHAEIEGKIKAREYTSVDRAVSGIKKSVLTKDEKKALIALARSVYAKAPKTPIVADGLQPTAQFAGNPDTRELGHELTQLALRVMNLAVKHRLSREEVFDRLKERTIVEG